jgi:nitroreductase/ferredoxin
MQIRLPIMEWKGSARMTSTPFEINGELCNHDGICAAECPARIIRLLPEDAVPVPEEDFAAYCIACGHCVAVCPTGAFSLSFLSPEQCPPVDKEQQLNREQAEQFLRSRRSIRSFREKPVERAKVEKLIEIACTAPSAKNAQPWHFTVVETPEKVRRLSELTVDMMRPVIQSQPALAAAVSFTRVVAAWDNGIDRVCRGAPLVIVVHAPKDYVFGAEDTALALSYVELFAPILGLGACWAGYLYTAANAHPPLFKALGLPRGHRAFGAIMLGYPQYRYHRMPLRRPPRVSWL